MKNNFYEIEKMVSEVFKCQSILMNMLKWLMPNDFFNDGWMNAECYVKMNNNNSMQDVN